MWSLASPSSNLRASTIKPAPRIGAMPSAKRRRTMSSTSNDRSTVVVPMKIMVSYKFPIGGRCMMMQRIVIAMTQKPAPTSDDARVTQERTMPPEVFPRAHMPSAVSVPIRKNTSA